ncbi:putative glucose-6-phosphate 1-epimerase isoform X2 [Miscanthus floridulus]|uniref:putative glucose-6-phosphate 1-epimerase isoform X2 n=1 Tax=Miscanthus floridulus TaxID=154761 RepID=UPI00345855CE
MSMGRFVNSMDPRSGLEVIRDWNGVAQVVLRSPKGASARVSLHGGQVVSWRNDRGEELLFTSSKAIFKPPNAMRGGIQMCFPQFGYSGTLERHGFARNRIWALDDEHPPLNHNDNGSKVSVDLILKPSEDDLKCWPHREVRIEGLETLDYLDNLSHKERFTEQGDAITFESEVDRVYVSSPNVVAILDHEKKHSFVIRKEGLPDVVVWNPWEKKSKTMVDFGDEEYKQMLCVDAAAVERAITLRPGEEWTGKLELSAVLSTNCSDHLDHPVSI